ncbi:hypothetical protein PHJA_001432100 [Phtheirospermum japonicum]|uniref:Uncharacterized protein n=1 Tax=Phtheirospermum japonicum TaxID=374723 RepID=A0A830C763_9LAMI|nr:hypothetical protein PHJA_001432100 [Phtheirospermum japonicum]
MGKIKRNKSIASNGQPSSSAPLKSNLKRSASMVEISPKLNQGMRKVSWSDAHGKDIAHVQEFEPR